MPEPVTIWVVSDGRAGIENQALGLAEAVGRITPAEIIIKRIRYAPLFDRLPTALKLFPDAMLRPDSDPLTAPYPDIWPDIWIAAGRATLPHSLRIKARSGGKTFVVQLQDPKHDPRGFDLVIAPEHDHISGGNVLSLIGSTNRITAQTLADAYTGWEDRLGALPHPRVAVLIGGRSKAYDIDEARASALGAEIHSAIAHAGGSVLLTVSRRTPEPARRILTDALTGLPGLIFDGQGENPYFAFLHAADRFLITEDSVNMATEAAATGKPIQILSMERRTLSSGEKFEDFHETLRAKGITHPFNGTLNGDAYPPLDETARAARHLLDAWRQRQS